MIVKHHAKYKIRITWKYLYVLVYTGCCCCMSHRNEHFFARIKGFSHRKNVTVYESKCILDHNGPGYCIAPVACQNVGGSRCWPRQSCIRQKVLPFLRHWLTSRVIQVLMFCKFRAVTSLMRIFFLFWTWNGNFHGTCLRPKLHPLHGSI